ncbi:MAG: energy transducer TonB [Candidatus Latescibacterota bacterium]
MIRSKHPQADLRLTYRKVLWISMGISVLVNGAVFLVFPEFEPAAYAKIAAPVIIQLEAIPETEQERRPPPPARPVVPIATDNPEVPDDVTIEDTDIDLSGLEDLPPPPPLVEETEAVPEVIELEEEEEEIVEIWKVEKQPEPVKTVRPEYPEIARKANITGKVTVKALVTKEGKVERAEAMSGPEVFHDAAVKAVLQWTFTPAIQNDRPVKVWVSVPFDFQLDD